MIILPDSGLDALVIRTDFSKSSKWLTICDAIKNPQNEIEAAVQCLDDPKFQNLDISELPRFPVDQQCQTYVLLVDEHTSLHSEYPVLCIDLAGEFGRSFRVIPSEIWNVTASLGIANMDFREFAEAVDDDGVFRGFR